MIASRKLCRSGKPCEPRTLVEAIYCLVHHSDISLPEIAEAIGKRPGYLSDAANPDLETVNFQSACLVPAMRATSNPDPAPVHGAGDGLRFVIQLPPATTDATDVRQRFMGVVKELGDVSAEIERALSGDERIDEAEFNRIDTQLSELLEAGAQLRHALGAARRSS